MWQFIISGYVPGTELQITFDLIATFSVVFFGTVFLLVVFKRYKTIKQEIEDIVAYMERLKEISL